MSGLYGFPTIVGWAVGVPGRVTFGDRLQFLVAQTEAPASRPRTIRHRLTDSPTHRLTPDLDPWEVHRTALDVVGKFFGLSLPKDPVARGNLPAAGTGVTKPGTAQDLAPAAPGSWRCTNAESVSLPPPGHTRTQVGVWESFWAGRPHIVGVRRDEALSDTAAGTSV